MLVAFLTNDLVFPSRLSGLAQRLGLRMETATTVKALLEKLATEPVVMVLLDLNLTEVDPTVIVPKLKTQAIPPRAIIAFGPHVHEEKLVAAKMAGCDIVLTRGQFDAQMENLLLRILQVSG